jgi:hypothetical protein
LAAEFNWCSVSRCASDSNANFVQRARIRSNRPSSSDRGSGAASSGPRVFLGSGLLDLGRSPLRLAPQPLCASSTSRRGLGARTLGPSCKRLVLGPWPLAIMRADRRSLFPLPAEPAGGTLIQRQNSPSRNLAVLPVPEQSKIPVIEVRHLEIGYGSFILVRDVSFTVRAGDRHEAIDVLCYNNGADSISFLAKPALAILCNLTRRHRPFITVKRPIPEEA